MEKILEKPMHNRPLNDLWRDCPKTRWVCPPALVTVCQLEVVTMIYSLYYVQVTRPEAEAGTVGASVRGLIARSGWVAEPPSRPLHGVILLQLGHSGGTSASRREHRK